MTNATNVTVAQAEALAELLDVVEDAFNLASDALDELTDPDVRDELREDLSQQWAEASRDLQAAVKALGDRS